MKKTVLAVIISGSLAMLAASTTFAQNSIGTQTTDPDVLLLLDNTTAALPQAMRITGLPAITPGAGVNTLVVDANGNLGFASSADLSHNLATDNLVQDAEHRTYDMNGKRLTFMSTTHEFRFLPSGGLEIKKAVGGNDKQTRIDDANIKLGIGSTTDNASHMYFYTTGNETEYNARISRVAGDNGRFLFQNLGTGQMEFDSNGGGADMVLDENGRVGIGTESPNQLLIATQATGDPHIIVLAQENGASAIISARSSDNGQAFSQYQTNDGSGNKNWSAGANPSDNTFRIDSNSDVDFPSPRFRLFENGNLTLAGTLTESSDSDLKTNITELDDALNLLASVRGVSYNWIDTAGRGDDLQIGVVAQEVEAVLPELVSVDQSGLKSVAYTKLTAVAIQAINELKLEQDQHIDALKAENAALKAQLVAVKTEMGKLQVLEASLKDLERRVGVSGLLEAKLAH